MGCLVEMDEGDANDEIDGTMMGDQCQDICLVLDCVPAFARHRVVAILMWTPEITKFCKDSQFASATAKRPFPAATHRMYTHPAPKSSNIWAQTSITSTSSSHCDLSGQSRVLIGYSG
jgi:hypothetical protein